MRRTLPPLNPLRSFEAAARHERYTAAAEELNVTQVAVSRQVRVLEDYLEITLFERGVRSLRLTDAGRMLLQDVSQAFDLIESAVANINRRSRRNALSVQVYTAFAQRWLIPRLPRFRKLHPHIEVDLRVSDQPLNFERHNLDAAIVSAISPPDEFDCHLLADRYLMPVCAPSLLKGGTPPLKPDALKKMTLLHSLARTDSWREWLHGAGADINAKQGSRLETSSLTLGAAVAGMGVAIGIRMLIEDELASGTLVVPFAYAHRSPRKYYLVVPRAHPPSSDMRKFMEWVLDEAAPYRV